MLFSASCSGGLALGAWPVRTAKALQARTRLTSEQRFEALLVYHKHAPGPAAQSA
jgi:hypothetical protein